MGLYHDLQFMKGYRHLRRARWPWTKLLHYNVFISMLLVVVCLPLITINLIGEVFERFGEWVRRISDAGISWMQENVLYKPLLQLEKNETRKIQFSRLSHRWRQHWKIGPRVLSKKESAERRRSAQVSNDEEDG